MSELPKGVVVLIEFDVGWIKRAELLLKRKAKIDRVLAKIEVLK
jgi:hypothetical protein